MSGVPQLQHRRAEHFSLLVALLFAITRLRTTWVLLLIMTFGMVVAVVTACTIPLFSDVVTTAGLRSTLRATPENTEITLNTATQRLSTPIAQAVHDQFDPLFHRSLGNALSLEDFSLLSDDFSFSPPFQNAILTIYSTSLEQAAAHLGPLQGRLARLTNTPDNEIEVMVTPSTAQRLGLHLGSTFTLSVHYLEQTSRLQQPVTARLVGLFSPTSATTAYWHGNDFNLAAYVNEATSTQYQYTLLVPYNALLALSDHIASLTQQDGVVSPTSNGYTFLWYYRLDPSHITINDLDSFIDRLTMLRSTFNSLYSNVVSGASDTPPSSPYLSRANLSSPLLSTDTTPSILEQFRSRIVVARIPIGVFALLSIALILFFVSLMMSVFLDHQDATIALLRSRGASRRQLFGTFLLQSAVLGVIALVIGLPCTVFTVLVLSQRVLPVSERDALTIITTSPLKAMVGMIGYALAVVLVALLTLSVSLFFATRKNVLSVRQEAARSSKRPSWQRLNIDVIAGIVALFGYGLSLYISSVGNVLSSDAQVLIATPLTIIAPFFLIIGCLFLFLRLFPLLLRIGARVASRGKGAVSLLAFAQMARSPRQSLRLTTLLALAIMFTLFTLLYHATEDQHIQDIVTYETGADFSVGLASTTSSASLVQVQSQFQSLPGVLSASVGRTDQGSAGTANLPVNIREVDPSSFSHSVIWPSSQAFQQAHLLLSKLVSLRQSAITQDAIPAIVTQTTLDHLLLHVGSFFTVVVNSDSPQALNCVIVGVMDHIPTINDRLVPEQGGAFQAAGGVLVDYQTYAGVFVQDVKRNTNTSDSIEAPAMNQMWLHTKDDADVLANVRSVLNNPQYQFSQLVDRRLLLGTLQSGPTLSGSCGCPGSWDDHNAAPGLPRRCAYVMAKCFYAPNELRDVAGIGCHLSTRHTHVHMGASDCLWDWSPVRRRIWRTARNISDSSTDVYES